MPSICSRPWHVHILQTCEKDLPSLTARSIWREPQPSLSISLPPQKRCQEKPPTAVHSSAKCARKWKRQLAASNLRPSISHEHSKRTSLVLLLRARPQRNRIKSSASYKEAKCNNHKLSSYVRKKSTETRLNSLGLTLKKSMQVE